MATKNELLGLLKAVYYQRGPRERDGEVASPYIVAKMTIDEVDAKWDFDDRQLMRQIAVALTS